MECWWCHGQMQFEPSLPHTGKPGYECVQCNKSDDIWHEIDVLFKHAIFDEEYVNWHTYCGNKEYYFRRKLSLPPVGKKGRSGRKSKWE